jgi:protein-S-isoprenylcysteine O-methyltransferase Ste14
VWFAVSKKKLLDLVITSLACCLVLFGMVTKIPPFLAGQWFNAGGAIVFYLLQFILFVFRRSSQEELTRPLHYGFALCGTCLPFLMAIHSHAPKMLTWLAIPLQGVGILFTILALATLGRGFGIFAANRMVKTHGLYQFIRHPLYTGEAIWFFSLVLYNFSLFNMLLFAVQIACQIKRMQDEEDLLTHDPAYAAYREQVRYRMIPGIF